MGVLVTSDGAITLPGVLLLVGTGLIGVGQYRSSADFVSTLFGDSSLLDRPIQSNLGLLFIAFGLILAVVANVLGVDDDSAGADLRLTTVKYEMMPPTAVLDELRMIPMTEEAAENTNKGMKATDRDTDGIIDDNRATHAARSKDMKTAICCLSALARRCGKEQKQRQLREQKLSETKSDSYPLEISVAEASSADRFLHEPHELEKICQEAAYIVLKLYPSTDATVSSAISLLALVAKDEEVRRRCIEEADKYGLNIPTNAMKLALTRSKQAVDPAEDDERFSAELQRKGCLLLGALSDNSKDMATKIVDEDGLIVVMDALDWYRCHEDVCNWGLWAIFQFCYEHKGNKAELIKLDGIRKICRVMNDVPESLEVAIAIMFDLLREMPETLISVSEIRRIAVGAGMHQVVRNAMDAFPSSNEIMMMGQQMLVATGYRGEI
eukprot:CAMPEP_0178596034 /NCGR_PEP_ID=MMETSP0697-20121206/31414_1 /TAXON_ID=265572 /ORGANISM="Extubocellulus spinifer, Strain CCMP396" /LENGTH=438 /DNA_ID=CAMNT_0020233549 /DNA_START=36 /DNA_END=1349 /DNA_ORIENTATION=-